MPAGAGTNYYHFQNPSSGWPMILREGESGRLVVETEEGEQGKTPEERWQPTVEDEADAERYTKAVAPAKDIDEAARLLRKSFGAADILI